MDTVSSASSSASGRARAILRVPARLRTASPTARRRASGSACFAASPRPRPTTTGALSPPPPGIRVTSPALPVAPDRGERLRQLACAAAAVRPGAMTSAFLPRPGARATTRASVTMAAGLVSARAMRAVGVWVMPEPYSRRVRDVAESGALRSSRERAEDDPPACAAPGRRSEDRRLRGLGHAHRVRRRRGGAHCRPDAVGLFDVSHMGKVAVHGDGSGGLPQLGARQRPRPHRRGAGPVLDAAATTRAAWSTT